MLAVHNGQTIPMKANFSMAQHFDKYIHKGLTNGMFDTFCFFVNFYPWHAENHGEHTLDQGMAKNGLFRDLPSFGCQLSV